MAGSRALPASLLRQWGAVPGPGEPWLESLAPLQYAAYGVRDTTGRPLGELNAPRPIRAELTVDVRACPYADSRAGIAMNFGALRGVGDHWPWVLQSVTTLSAAWSARADARREPLDLPGLWTFSAALLAMPLFLLRTGAATDGTIPASVSALFKVMQGVFISAWRMWITDPQRPATPDVEEMTRTVVDRGLLHNTHVGRVCPAPESMIRELFTAVLRSGPPGEPVGETDALFAYGSAYAALSIVKWLSVEPASPATRAAAQLRDRLAGWSDGSPERDEERFTLLQRAACQACGRPGPEQEFQLAWIPRRGPQPASGRARGG